MITRHYFVSTKCNTGDGNGSYSYTYATGDYKSWLPDPVKVFKSMIENAKEGYVKRGLNADSIEILAFNQV